MIEASEAWKGKQQAFIAPEMFVEISSALTEEGVQELAVASGTNEAIFSDLSNVTGIAETQTVKRYATLEHNLWILNGSRSILPDDEPYANAGYVSDIAETGSVTLTLPEVHTKAIPGVTIHWSSEFDEYPPVFTVTAKNGDTVVAETTITDNDSNTSLVDLEISGYDSVTVTVHNWCLPQHRARVDMMFLGHLLTFNKDNIISFTHEQRGDLLTGELPKYSIDFTVDNTDGRWNPSNPSGTAKYLSERQKVSVRYGLDIDGTTEWIKAGTFYLSEWSAPSNGLEAQFVARDVLEFLLNVVNPAAYYSTLDSLIESAIYDLLPEEAAVSIDTSLSEYSASYNGDGTSAEMVQKAANAGRCILRYDRDGVLHVEPLSTAHTGALIPLALSYSHPEITLSKPLKKVSVDYGGIVPYELSVASAGEAQTVTNSFVTDETQAAEVAKWVRDVLQSRKTVSGEFRADPRLDLYDVVTVESKFGTLSPVVLTEIKYTFSGSFRASYVGRVVEWE